MAQSQRVYKRGIEYLITGPGEKARRVDFVGKFKIENREVLMFRPVRKARKHTK
jgi:hypothetical protein